jgi:tRNA pseudouridine55 synthase
MTTGRKEVCYMNGILPLWKPAGMTSHDCVFRLRKLLRTKKVGHTGTLDPEVTGVLPICIGRATKVADYVMNSGKEYIAEVTLGVSMTTEDAHGEVVETKKVDHPITSTDINQVLESFKGEIEQTPPMFSAVKVNGKKLYEYARQGIEIERPSRKVLINELELLSHDESVHNGTYTFSIRVDCTKGTYIRTLAVMIGKKLGYPAHMSSLIRTKSGSFTKDDCFTFEMLEELVEKNETHHVFFPLERGLNRLPIYELNDTLAGKVKNGALLPLPEDWPKNQEVGMYFAGHCLAIYQIHPTKQEYIKPVKVLMND